jgi:hypothetical protein
MAIVTGAVVDFQGSPRADLHPQIVFIPKGPSVRGSAAFFSREITVTPDADGLFSVALIDTANFPGDFYYIVRIDWLNGAGVPVGRDYLPGQLRVPAAGGALPALLGLPATIFDVWVGEENNLAYGFWYQPSTTNLWSNP